MSQVHSVGRIEYRGQVYISVSDLMHLCAEIRERSWDESLCTSQLAAELLIETLQQCMGTEAPVNMNSA